MNGIVRLTEAPSFPADAAERVADHFLELVAVQNSLVQSCIPDIVAAARLIAIAMFGGHKLLICGNGGSAGDSQHIAAEFVSVLNQSFVRPALPAIALTTDSSMLTASANDFGFDGVFERQIQALGNPNDVLLGITTSGNSKNVIRAVEWARANRIKTVGLTGGCKGKIDNIVDAAIRVPSDSTQHIQESHIAVGHIICDLVERSLFARKA